MGGGCYLLEAYLRGANLSGAHLIGAHLSWAYLIRADLRRADLSGANLYLSNLSRANLKETKFEHATMGPTILADVDLSSFVNAQIKHMHPSNIDHRSIARSLHCANLFPFLVATGMNHIVATYLIDSIRSLDPNGLFNLMHSTFISYGGPDEPFAIKLRETLQTNGVTTFLFKEDAVPGESLCHVMRAGIREHERVVLICSEASLNRSGVLNEIELTLRREASAGGATLLIPLAIDRYVFDDWNPKNDDLREAVLERVIADFEYADTDQSKFDQGIERLLQALKVSD